MNENRFFFPKNCQVLEAQTSPANRNELTGLNVTSYLQIELNGGMHSLPPAALATERPAAHSAVSFCEALNLHLSQRFRYESLIQGICLFTLHERHKHK